MKNYLRNKLPFDSFNEECGIFGAFCAEKNAIIDTIYFGLYAIQHRGQEAAGAAIAGDGKIFYHKDLGLVSEIFGKEVMESMPEGNIAVGHVRYSTAGKGGYVNIQPLVMTGKSGKFAVSHNGNILNVKELREELISDGVTFQTTMDTEVIAALINKYADKSIEEGLQKAAERMRGAFSMLVMTADKLIAVRDPHGIRPLCVGRIGKDYIFSSESVGLDAVNATFEKDLEPGEIFVVDRSGAHSLRLKKKEGALCVFEFVYFARPDSTIDGCSVYGARKEAGKLLAENDSVSADIVSGVPDSGLVAARGYSEQSGIKYAEAITKNRYVGRTFIQSSQKQREASVRIKLNALRYNVDGKKIVLLDDSIVRGTTSRKIIDMLRNAGAKEVHLRIHSPVVKHPCYFGIDIQTYDQLIGARKTPEEICAEIGADSLKFMSIEDLYETVKHSKAKFCMGCFTGEYPEKIEKDQNDRMKIE